MIRDLRLPAYNSGLGLASVRDAARSYIISMRASMAYQPRYIESMVFSCALLASYAEERDWPPVSQLSAEHMEAYIGSIGQRPRWFGRNDPKDRPPSVSHAETQYRRLKTFFSWLVQRGHLESNPLGLVKRPRPPQKVVPTVKHKEADLLYDYLTKLKTINSFYRFYGVRDLALFMLLADTPSRRDEAARLTVHTVDVDAGYVQVMGKGNRERIMPIGPATCGALWEWLLLRAQVVRPGYDDLWVNYYGLPMKPAWVYQTLKRIGQRVGIPNLHTHRFRHTFTIEGIAAEVPTVILERMGGWKKIPETYTRTAGEITSKPYHQRMSPADALARRYREGGASRKSSGKARGDL